MIVIYKRAIAFFVDTFVFAPLFILCQQILMIYFPNIPPTVYFILLIPLFFRDMLFKNASLGKKALGLVVFDEQWQKPNAILLAKRSFFTMVIGYIMLCKIIFIDGNIISFFDWERDVVKARVVEKKVYNELKEKVEISENGFASAMTMLYSEYLLGRCNNN